ncbi:MAG: tetratricopeptide repeat protein [Planctomycetota bacterium]|nr:tetratricopeptide repeat protein [Planctomycetota bacterium]
MLNLTGSSLGIYEVGAEIGRGGMGTVYCARTTAAGPAGKPGSIVAVKVFHPELVEDERIVQRFQREAEIGMKIDHPHVVSTYEICTAEVDGKPYCFMVMELIEGQSLREVLVELGTLPEHLIYQIADQVLDALGAVHDVGMIHRDVKPENIVLTLEHKVLLMDLGVARLQQEGRDLTRAGEFVGSIHYAAPEQFTDQDNVGPLIDLYSFGVVLYELATGKNPFGAAELTTLLTQKVQGLVRRPRLASRDIDPFLDEVILTCLKSDPAERFSSCGELRAVMAQGEDGTWWQERTQGEAFPAATRALKCLRAQRETPLVGRGSALDHLHSTIERAQTGAGRVVLLAGAAGTGKSRLVHEFLEELIAPDGPILLAGRCPEGGGRAYQALIEAAHGFFGERADLEQRLEQLLPEMVGDVPKVAQFLRGESDELLRDTLLSAYGSLLRNLSAGRPVVLVIEDLHRAGPETIELFGYLARIAPEMALLMVGTYRPEAVEGGSELHSMITVTAARPEADQVSIEPLSRESADEVIRCIVKQERTVRSLGRPLYERSDGNPHVLLEMLAHLRSTGVLQETEDGLAVSGNIEDADLPSGLRDLIARKLQELEPDEREMLDAAAVQGAEFEASLLAAATGQKRIRLLKRLAVLERKHRLVLSSGKNAFRFASQILHHVVYAQIRGQRRTDYHAKFAEALLEAQEGKDAWSGESAYSYVHHLLRAGRMAEAKEHLSAAVEHCATNHHPAHAAAFLGQLLAALGENNSEARFDVCIKLAEVHAMLGRREERMGALNRAGVEAARLGLPGPRGRVHAGLAEAYLRAGSYDKAGAEAREGLALATEAGDRGGEADCLHTLGSIAYRRGDFSACAAFCKDALVIRRATGDARGEGAAMQALGAVMPEIGQVDEALDTKRAALEIYRELGYRRGEGAALNNLGNSYMEAQQVQEAVVCYEQAIQLARDVGDLPAEANARYNRGRALAVLARIEDARDSLERALDLFREIGDPSGEAEVLDELGSAVATVGEREEALTFLESARNSACRTGQNALLGRVLRHLANVHHENGSLDKAWRFYVEALGLATARSRILTLADMGNAALKEGAYDRSVKLLQEAVESGKGGSRMLLSLCRLARAHKEAGRDDKAEEYGKQAERLLEEQAQIAPQYGPEIYYSLGTVFEVGERGRRYLATANELLGARTRSIRSIVHRQHYLTMTWPNREILDEARRIFQQS